MDTTVLCALVAAIAVVFYVLLDGFDLGVGALLLLARDEAERDLMVESIAPVWDGNETWLIMAGVTLLGAFPIAYGVLLPALYLPLLIMLWALGFRGVSFEFRFQTERWRWLWDRTFCAGSVIAAFCQGLVLGGLLQGIRVEGQSFAGCPLDFLTPFSVLTGVSVLAGYIVIGAGWLIWRTEGTLEALARRILRRALPGFGMLVLSACLAAAAIQPRVAVAWSSNGIYLSGIALAFALCAGVCWNGIDHRNEARSFFAGIGLFAICLAGLAPVIWPFIVPFALTIWDAASPTASKLFLLVGCVVLMPVVIGYSAFAYWVFRGKTKAIVEADA